MVRLTKARLGIPAGPPETLSAATLGPAPEGNTVISNGVVALELATDVAVTVTVVLLVTLNGAAWVTAGDVGVLSEPIAGKRLHVTPLLLVSFVSVALIPSCCP